MKNYKIKLLVALLISIIVGLLLGWPANYTETKAEAHEEQKTKTIEKDKFEIWLDKLVEYECALCADGFSIIDTNGARSYGCLQFQEATFEYYSRKYKTTGDIHSCTDQRALAREMFRREREASPRNWYTSIYVRGLGLPPAI